MFKMNRIKGGLKMALPKYGSAGGAFNKSRVGAISEKQKNMSGDIGDMHSSSISPSVDAFNEMMNKVSGKPKKPKMFSGGSKGFKSAGTSMRGM